MASTDGVKLEIVDAATQQRIGKLADVSSAPRERSAS